MSAAALAFCLGLAAPAKADTPRAVAAYSVRPRVLPAGDIKRYKKIFADERTGKFKAAKTLAAELEDRCLIGYVEAEHLLSPHSGHAKPAQLNEWLRQYGELSIADRIRALSERRTVKKGRIPAPPHYRWRGGGYEDYDIDPPPSSEAAKAAAVTIKDLVRHDQPDAALAILKTLQQDTTVPAGDIAHLSHDIANSYLAEGMDEQAYGLADAAAGDGRGADPLLDWSAGLAAFRLGHFDDAALHYRILAEAGQVASWTRAAAAFWAARSYMASAQPRAVVSMLTAAAREEPTFYGMLAQRILGQRPDSEFHPAVLTAAGFETLMKIPEAHRAVALWQLGEEDAIANEMNRAFAQVRYPNGAPFAALAKAMDLPNIELRASETEAAHGNYLTGLFPVPQYKPVGGYSIDPSLLLAIARVETHFEPEAVSPAGAYGLTQIMPGTARVIMGRPVSEDELEDPSFNLMLGQRYTERLLRAVNNNLFQLAAAYNAGPGSLNRWLDQRAGKHDDPLLFIESVPSAETRAYIKRFMMYHWLYRRRMDMDSPTLDATARGDWPIYRAAPSARPVERHRDAPTSP